MDLLLLWAMLGVASVAVCSMLETTLFSVRVSALGERKVAGSEGAAKLPDIKHNRIEDAIGAIEDLMEVLLGMEITDEAEAVERTRRMIAESRKNRGEALRRRRMFQHPVPD